MSDDMSFNLPENKAPWDNTESGRSFGKILSDIGEGAITRAAQAGNIKGILPALFFGGIEGGIMGSPADRALQKQQLDNEYKQALIDQAKQATEQSKERHAVNMANAKTQQEFNALQLQNLQAKSDAMLYENAIDTQMKGLTANLGLDNRTYLARHLIERNPAVRLAVEMEALENLYMRDPQLGRRLFRRTGWDIERDKDGNLFMASLDGKIREPFDPARNRIQEVVDGKMREALEAADLFESVHTLQQGSIRNVITTPEVAKYFSVTDANGKAQVDYVAAYSAYKKYIKDAVSGKAFSEEDITGHMLSRTLQEALIDNKFTPEELQVLMPQFEMYLRKFRATASMPDGNPQNAVVKFADGSTKGIMQVAADLQKNDRVMKGFEASLATAQLQKQQAAINLAKTSADLRKATAQAVAAERKAGTGVSGNETADAPLADWDNESKALYNEGKTKARELNINLPEIEGQSKEDVNLGVGIAYNKAEQAFVETGDWKKAQTTFKETLSERGWKDSQIPDLWGKNSDEQELEQLEKRNRFLRDRLNEKRSRGGFESQMITTAELPGATDIDRAIPVGVRVEDADAREYKRNIDRISELRKKQHQRNQDKKQAAEYRKRYQKKAQELADAAKRNR